VRGHAGWVEFSRAASAPSWWIGDVGLTVGLLASSLGTVPDGRPDPIEASGKVVGTLWSRWLPWTGFAGLKPQAPAPRAPLRPSNYEPETLIPPILAKPGEPWGWIGPASSDNQFFSFFDLPSAGMNKGSTIERLLQLPGTFPEAVLVTAGDTLNDLSMFETGLKGSMVGNCRAQNSAPSIRSSRKKKKKKKKTPIPYLAQRTMAVAGINRKVLRHFGNWLAPRFEPVPRLYFRPRYKAKA